MGAGNYAYDDAANLMGESSFCLSGEIRGVDAGRKAAATGFSRVTGGQGPEGSCPRVLVSVSSGG